MKPHHLVRGTLSEAEITLRIAAARSLRERGASPTTRRLCVRAAVVPICGGLLLKRVRTAFSAISGQN
jgi:hypothetical protein